MGSLHRLCPLCLCSRGRGKESPRPRCCPDLPSLKVQLQAVKCSDQRKLGDTAGPGRSGGLALALRREAGQAAQSPVGSEVALSLAPAWLSPESRVWPQLPCGPALAC